MPVVAELVLYPIKSCAGVSVPEATLTRAGLAVGAVYDREWMVIDAAGRFLSQRDLPRMALIVPRLGQHAMILGAPGMAPLAVPLALPDDDAPTLTVQCWDDQVLAYDGEAATAAWFTEALGRPCRLVRFHAAATRAVSTKWTGGVDAPTLFSDGYPVLVVGSASLADLNTRLLAAGRAALPMNRFRPNLVIDGIDAFEEDYSAAFTLGAAVLTPVKPCPRCPMPSVDQASGVVGPDPLDILQSYRRKAVLDDAICFGMNAIVTAGEGERLFVGQTVGAELDF